MSQEFLNTELKPYSELTREEKHILLDAMIDGNCERHYEDGWYETKEFDDRTHRVYRTKPKEYKKLNVPWNVIDEKWKWAAMDESGSVEFFECEPSFKKDDRCVGDSYWICELDYTVSCLKLDTTGIIAEHSLTQRPE